MEAMEALIDSKTKAILINNPSNPCGSSYSLDHLRTVVALADRHKLPIISDEIYGGVVFNGEFNPIQIVRGAVPVLALGGVSLVKHQIAVSETMFAHSYAPNSISLITCPACCK